MSLSLLSGVAGVGSRRVGQLYTLAARKLGANSVSRKPKEAA